MNHLPDDVAAQIAASLMARQAGRSDEAFAALLGITRVHWSHLRAGRRKPSYALVRRAARLYPELASLVLRDLMTAPSEAAS